MLGRSLARRNPERGRTARHAWYDRASLAPPPEAAMPITLTVVRGPQAGRSFALDGHETFLVGRSASAHFSLPDDPYFSRHHFLVESNPPLCRLSDLDSHNGTSVNGEPVGRRRPGTRPGEVPPADTSPRTLHDGDTVRICSVEFEVNPADRSAVALSINSFLGAIDSMTRRAS